MKNEQPLTEWYTVNEIATTLKVSRSVVYQIIESGALTAHRIGNGRGTIRVAKEEFARYLESCLQLPTQVSSSFAKRTRRDLTPQVFKHLDVSGSRGLRNQSKPR